MRRRESLSGRMRMAEGEGFEPPDLSVNGFQDRRLRPLGHPSTTNASSPKVLLSRRHLGRVRPPEESRRQS